MVLSETDSPCAIGERSATGWVSVVTNVNVAAASTNSRIAVADGRFSGWAAETRDVIVREYTLAPRKMPGIVTNPRSRTSEEETSITGESRSRPPKGLTR